MANAGCINAIGFDGCFLQTLQQLDSACIGVGVQFTAPNPLDDKRFDYIKYTDKCGNTCCLTGENEILIYATQGVIKNLTLTNDDANEVVNVKRTDVFGSNWKKTVVRYKTGGYPTSITDGTLAVEETTMNQYSSTGYNVSGLDDATTYYFSVFAIAQDDTVIVVQSDSITTDFDRAPTSNTLIYIKNNGNILDYSQYSNNHSMNRAGTSSFETLTSGRKVANFSGSNVVYCPRFAEGMGKTTFTMHCRMKNKINTSTIICGRRDRNDAGPGTPDKWGMLFGADSSSKQYTSYGAPDRQSTSIGIYTDTSAFYLYTATVNGRSVAIYKNGNLVGTWTGTQNIIGGSNTGGKFYIGGFYGYSEQSYSGNGTQMYTGHVIVEDKVRTQTEIQSFFNKTKKFYGIS